NGRLVVTVMDTPKNEGQDLVFHRLSDGEQVGARIHESKSIDQFTFSPDGKRIASVSGREEVRIWNVDSGQLVTPVFKPFEPVLDMWFTDNGKQLVVAGGVWDDDGPLRHFNFIGARWSIQVWDPSTGSPVTQAMTYGDATVRGWFSSDRTLLATTDGHG